ncbi:heavy metal sensor histidine kinase [Acinetobacter sp. NS-4]|uniref:heavy metal sensor histidine kinase n=1 Tax=Acinetobacter sp. NS-4 TaxID=3127956 RepID=UPI00307FA5BD
MRNKVFQAISFKISLVFSFFTIVIFMILGLVINQLVIHHFQDQDRSQLEGKVQLIQNLLKQYPENSVELPQYLHDALVGHHDLIVQVERPTGQIIFSSMPSAFKSPIFKASSPTNWLEWQIQDRSYRGLVEHTATAKIIIGIDTLEHAHFLKEFRQQLLIICLIGTFCLMLLGWLAAWKGLKPVQNMAQVAEGISAQHLSERLDVEHTPSELRALATAFNDMLDRLESALEKLADFSSDLAHEIRTPINNLMTQTQVCLSRKRDVAAYQEVLFSNLEEFERLARMVSDMLFLAKAEHGLYLPHSQPVDLVEEITALFDFYDALAAEKGMRLHQTGSGTVVGDPLMLRRALSNLLSNAIKYGQPNSIIKVNCQQKDKDTIVSIENAASELNPDQLSRLFDRFYRTDSSRQRTEEGTGLGLAITKSILDLHGASIQAESRHGKIIFTLVFPG